MLETIRENNRLAVDAMHHNRLDDALLLLQRALQTALSLQMDNEDRAQLLRENLNESQHPLLLLAATHSNLGCMYKRWRRWDDSVRHLQTAKDLETEVAEHQLQLFGEAKAAFRGPSCSTLMNLGTVLLALERYDEALPMAERCVRLSQELLSKASPGNVTTAPGSPAVPPATALPPRMTQQARAAAQVHVIALYNYAIALQSHPDPNIHRHGTTALRDAYEKAKELLGANHPTTVTIEQRYQPGNPNGNNNNPPLPNNVRQRSPSFEGAADQHNNNNNNMMMGSGAGGLKLQPRGASAAATALPPVPPSGQRPSSQQSKRKAAAAVNTIDFATPNTVARSSGGMATPSSNVLEGATFTNGPQQSLPPVMGGGMMSSQQGAALDASHPQHQHSSRSAAVQPSPQLKSAEVPPAAVVSLVQPSELPDVLRVAASPSPLETVLTVPAQMAPSSAAANVAAAGSQHQQQSSSSPPPPPRPNSTTSPSSPLVSPQYGLGNGGASASQLPPLFPTRSTALSARGGATPSPSVAGPRSVSVLSGMPSKASRPSSADSVMTTTNAPSFMRFAPRQDPLPPAPSTYSDIRRELRMLREVPHVVPRAVVRRESEITRDVAQAAANATTSQSALHLAAAKKVPHPTTLAGKRKLQMEQQEEEERAVREKRRQEKQLAQLEEAKRQRMQQLLLEKQFAAARVIQRAYRRWWRTTGFTKYVQRQQRENNKLRRAQNNKDSFSGTGGGGGGSSAAPHSVVKYARRWLEKTAGPRLMIRLGAGRQTAGGFQQVDLCVRRIQRLWRSSLSRLRRFAAKQRVTKCMQEIVKEDKRVYAAKQIQGVWRIHMARARLSRLRKDFYWSHVVCIQTWFRKLQHSRKVQGARARRLVHCGRAAIMIQRLWRGYQGRVQACMQQVKRRVQALKRQEHNQSVALQRICRGYQCRKRMVHDLAGYLRHVADQQRRQISLDHEARQQRLLLQEQAKSALTPYQVKALQRAADAEAVATTTERERAFHLDLYVKPSAARELQQRTTIHDAAQIRRDRAADSHLRSLEAATLQRLRAVRRIQQAVRSWLNDRRPFENRSKMASLTYQRGRIQANEAAALQRNEQQRLRAQLDLAQEPRDMKNALVGEIQELEPTVRRHAADEDIRTQKERRVVGQSLAKQEHALKRQQQESSLALQSALPTFLSVRQRAKLGLPPTDEDEKNNEVFGSGPKPLVVYGTN